MCCLHSMVIHKFATDFKNFIKEYGLVTLAIAFVMGQATNDLVRSFVTNLFMPSINPLIPGGNWENATATIGSVELGWGIFLSNLLNFVIIALVIFIVVKKVMKYEKVKK